LGFPDREPESLSDSRDKLRVAVIGDSFVEAVQVAVEDKFHVLLEQMVNNVDHPRKMRTWAFGYSGTGQINQLPYYDAYARAFSPRLVVLVVVNNDISNNSPVLEALRHGWSPFHQPRLTAWFAEGDQIQLQEPSLQSQNFLLDNPPLADVTILDRVTYRVHKRSYLWRYLSVVLSSYFSIPASKFSGEQTPEEDYGLFRFQQIMQNPELAARLAGQEPIKMNEMDSLSNPPGPAHRDALRLTDFTLSEWKKRAQADGFTILALLTEGVAGYCGGNYKEHPHRGHWVSILEKYNIPYVETCDTIIGQNRTSRESRFRYDSHWSEQGHIWAAETVKAYIDSHPELFSE
jgi:hypothetical protein